MQPRLLSPEATWRVHDETRSALLVDGRDYYRAFYAAAMRAQRSILLLGWQFDSDVELLRGPDLPEGIAPEDVELLAVLDRLCRDRPGLEARILAWDHSVVFALEREVLQKLWFDAITCERFRFAWDATVPLGGSHHQKVAIIDGQIAFFGSADICQSRWDESSHRLTHPERLARGAAYAPYHEVQVAVTGAAARSFVDLFIDRWEGATGERIDPETLILPGEAELTFPMTLPLPRARLGLARTIPKAVERPAVTEVSALYVRAIERAQRLVYIETQYLTSCALRDALLARMKDDTRPRLEIVLVLPHKPEKLKEELTIGGPQALLLQNLSEAARAGGHAFGVYEVVAGAHPETGAPVHVYIHSKLMIVDDAAFLVGSANLTNRSMSIDSEIVGAYEADGPEDPVGAAIQAVRVRLLDEHVGLPGVDLATVEGLVARLDAWATIPESRLRKHEADADEPSLFAKAVQELTADVLDPWDGGEKCPAA